MWKIITPLAILGSYYAVEWGGVLTFLAGFLTGMMALTGMVYELDDKRFGELVGKVKEIRSES